MDRQTQWLEIYRKNGTPQMNADIAASGKSYDTQREQTQKTYNQQIRDTESSYEDLYRENAVQKFINEKEIAENMANLGLTDSGLNRTQQTAAQLSYANSKNKIDVNRRKAVDSLTLALANAISSIDTEKAQAAEKIRSSYESSWQSAAQSTYAKELEEETAQKKAEYDYNLKLYEKQQKAQEEAAKRNVIWTDGGLLQKGHGGTLSDRHVDVIKIFDSKGNHIKTQYIDNITGKQTTMDSKVNPYVGGPPNPDTKWGVNANGYQPNNYKGVPLRVKQEKAVNIRGNIQSVWTTGKKDYIWDGEANKYKEAKLVNGQWVIA